MRRLLDRLKRLPQTLLPAPGSFLPGPERLRTIEAGLGITIGVVLTGLGAGMLLGRVSLPVPPLALMSLLVGKTALGLAYGAWRSKHYHKQRSPDVSRQTEGRTSGNMYRELEQKGQLWIWGWAVMAQFLAGLSFLSIALSAL